MKSLRQIMEFVGISGGEPENLLALLGMAIPQPTMRSVPVLVPVLTDGQRSSMQMMISALQSLPPVSLEAEAVDTVNKIPFNPTVRVQSSSGVVIRTTATIFQDGVMKISSGGNVVGPQGGIVHFATLDVPGNFQLELERIGIPGTGITLLKKSFNVLAKTSPAVGPQVPVKHPSITVKANNNGDGSFEVNGTGFQPKTKVTITVTDANAPPQANRLTFQKMSETDGSLVGLQTGVICNHHTQISFFGQDGSLDPSNHQPIFSNFVPMTCS